MNCEASLPGWHRQETPPLIIGVHIGDLARDYDFARLKERRMVMVRLGDTPLLIATDPDGSSAFVFDRRIDDQVLGLELSKGGLADQQTRLLWDHLGRCHLGELKGRQLIQLQSCQQFVRAQHSFHGHTGFCEFQAASANRGAIRPFRSIASPMQCGQRP